MHSPKLFVISGPSGVGKGTVIKLALAQLTSVWVSVSATTRPPRPGEEEGVAYFFLSDEEFDRLIAEDGLLEWATFNGHRYGTVRSAVFDHLNQGTSVILEIDVQGARAVRESCPDAYLVFIAPPSMEVLEARLRGRGTESDEAIAGRLATASVELSQQMLYDAVLVNDELSETVQALVTLIHRVTGETPSD